MQMRNLVFTKSTNILIRSVKLFNFKTAALNRPCFNLNLIDRLMIPPYNVR